MRSRFAVLGVLPSLVIAACSSGPPDAKSVAEKIPGCHPRAITDESVYATAEVTCDIGPFVMPAVQQVTVWVATFASASDARSWLLSIGSGSGPGLPAGGCVQGSGWAADITVNDQSPAGPIYVKYARALGGRIVSAGYCY